jgi:Type II secretion system (T2SS), protein M subtype b
MKLPNINSGALRTRLDIAVWRYGWLWLLVLALTLILMALELGWHPRQQASLEAQRTALAQQQQQYLSAEKTQRTSARSSDVPHDLESLDRYTVSQQDVGTVLREVLALGGTHGVALTQSEFQTSNEGHGGLQQVQITLPVRASYTALRAFTEATLRQHPMVSMDQINMKREAITQGIVEVRLKLSIWVDPQKTKPTLPTSTKTPARGANKL